MKHNRKVSVRGSDSGSGCCHRFNNILLLSIIWTMLFTETMARPNLDALFINKPNELQQQQHQQQQEKRQQQQQDIFLDEMITSTNSDKLFNKLVNTKPSLYFLQIFKSF